MLKDPAGNPITSIPHSEDYQCLLDHLTPEEQNELTKILIEIIGKARYHNSHLLGSRNIKTIPRLHELLLKASNGDEGMTGRDFGLYLFVTFMQLDEEWFVQKPRTDGRYAEKGYNYYRHPKDLQKRYLRT